MAKLILEEGGERRAFRFQKGKLTIGSGEGCSLTLKSPDIAEVHCDLEFGEDRVVLRARPGVMPPLVNGASAPGETVLGASSVIEIGDATIRVDLDEVKCVVVHRDCSGSANQFRRCRRHFGSHRESISNWKHCDVGLKHLTDEFHVEEKSSVTSVVDYDIAKLDH